jgi:hypothetical protein
MAINSVNPSVAVAFLLRTVAFAGHYASSGLGALVEPFSPGGVLKANYEEERRFQKAERKTAATK